MSIDDNSEIYKFNQIGSQWWDEEGPFKPLHRLNPTRIAFLRQELASMYGEQSSATQPLKGLSLIDVGCGGGLVTEPLARLGASMTGIDASAEAIFAAKAHAQSMGLEIVYHRQTAEALQQQLSQEAENTRFDAVIALEIIEHVNDIPAFLKVCKGLLKPGGILFLSTLNRTLKSFMLGIVTAEYLLRWVPKGTHQWNRFVKPSELMTHARSLGLELQALKGITFHPLTGEWRLSSDVQVNYIMSLKRNI